MPNRPPSNGKRVNPGLRASSHSDIFSFRFADAPTIIGGMNTTTKSAWSVVIILCLLSLAFIFAAGIVRAEPLSFAERIARAIPALCVKGEPAVDPAELTSAVLAVTTDPQWAALILTVGEHESGFAARIMANRCRKHECDDGRASGAYQSLRNPYSAATPGAAFGV